MDAPQLPRDVPERFRESGRRPSYSALQQPIFDGLLAPELVEEIRDTITWRRRWKTLAYLLEGLAQLFLGIGSVLVTIGWFIKQDYLLLVGSCCTPVGLLFLRGSLYAERERKKCEGRYWALQATIGIAPARRRGRPRPPGGESEVISEGFDAPGLPWPRGAEDSEDAGAPGAEPGSEQGIELEPPGPGDGGPAEDAPL